MSGGRRFFFFFFVVVFSASAGGIVDWSGLFRLLSLFAELNLLVGDAGAGVDAVVGGGRLPARRDPAPGHRDALPGRNQLRRYLPCSPHLRRLQNLSSYLRSIVCFAVIITVSFEMTVKSGG